MTLESQLRDLVARLAREEVRRALTDALRPDEFLSPTAAAKMADVSPSTIRAWVKAGKLARHGVGKKALRISRKELEVLLKFGGVRNDELSPEELAARRFG